MNSGSANKHQSLKLKVQVLTIYVPIYQHSPQIHQKRLNTLIIARRALINADYLTLTHLGRHIDGTNTLFRSNPIGHLSLRLHC